MNTNNNTVVISDDVQALLNAFRAEHNRECTLAPSDIQEMLDAQEGEVSISAMLKDMAEKETEQTTEAEQEKAPAITSEEYSDKMAMAIKAARKADDSDEFKTELAEDLKAKERGYVGPVNMCLILGRIFTQDEMNGFPDVGTTKDDVKTTNRPYDVFVAPPKPGEKKGKRTSVWDMLADKTTAGAALVTKYDALAKAKSKTEGYDPALLKQYPNARLLESATNSARAAVNYYRSLIKDGRKVWELLRDINAMTNVKAQIFTEEKDGKKYARNLREPIAVHNADWSESATFSVGSFKAFKPGKAKVDSYSALIDTLARNTDGGGTTDIPEIKNIDMFEQGLAAFAAWLKTDKNQAKLTERIAKAKKDKDYHFILSFGDVVMAFDGDWSEVADMYRHASKNRDKIAA